MESTMKPTLLLDLNLLSNNNYLSSDGNTCCSLVSVSEPPVASNSSKEQDNLSFTSTSSLALSSSSSSNCSTSPSSQSPPSSLCFKLREEEEEEEDVEVEEERVEKNEENDILLSQISTSTGRPHFFSQFTSTRNKIKRNKSLSFINLGPKITLTKKLSFSSKQHQLEQQQEQERQRYQQKNQQTKPEEFTVTTTTSAKSLPSKSKSMNRLLEVPLASSVKMISWFKEFKNRKNNSSKKSNDSSVATSNDENDSPSRVTLEQFTPVDSASSTSSIELTNDTLNNLNINSNSNSSNISSSSCISSSSRDCDNSNANNNCDRNSSDDIETKNKAPANFKENNNNNNDSNITSIETNLPARPLLHKPIKTWSPVSSSSSSASSSPSSISYLLPSYSFASPRTNNSNSFGGYYRSNSQIKTTNTIRTTPNSPRTAAYQPRPRFDPRSVQKLVLEWCQFHTKDYKNVNITNFSSSWSDGLAFCALIHNFLPDSFDYSRLESNNRYENFELAFDIALKQANISPLLEVDDMIRMGNRPDDRCVYTYVSTIYSRFKSLKPMEKTK